MQIVPHTVDAIILSFAASTSFDMFEAAPDMALVYCQIDSLHFHLYLLFLIRPDTARFRSQRSFSVLLASCPRVVLTFSCILRP